LDYIFNYFYIRLTRDKIIKNTAIFEYYLRITINIPRLIEIITALKRRIYGNQNLSNISLK